ncbi:hypothetical protein JCM8115_005068 [Rhodotorula mucilaginosa]|uniref:Williams-Beuren syndrome chromosome region 16 protein n=1 Tax=Rhodotorula mucilaginosa TaxID=5537 RepID=A0A9P7B948_RHOMI|nr:Williams-Beuren syndrome chromosome region 16 protein [Rhodotorula mucilaginosa]TKA58472.1 hypothetical protein B0A53_00211 [Rhodotorula sp. CCFEE 5036]
MLSPATTRALTRTVSHLVLAGDNPLAPPGRSAAAAAPSSRQAVSNPSPAQVPLSTWLASVGRETDVERGYQIKHVAGGAGHQLVSYRNYEGFDRIFALGRNEAGQLGVGFASQEGTRALVEGFEGDQVLAVRAGVQSSYILVRDGDSTRLYSMGNLARGRLGHATMTSSFNESESAAGEEPRLHLVPRATAVTLPPEIGPIKQIEAGFEHVLLLTESGDVYGTGCNTDGQIGLGDASGDVVGFTKIALPSEIVQEGGVARICAGADTSALVTESGRVWTWGNSEYAQALHDRKIDQILRPLAIDDSFVPPNRRLVDYRCGGSFALALDDRGSVYTAGFGALGLGASVLRSPRPRRVDALEGQGIERIRAGWGYAAAIRDAGPESAIFTWGLNSTHGRLGLGTLASSRRSFDPTKPPAVNMHVHVPEEVALPLRELGLDGTVAGRESVRWRLGEVELAMEGLWVGIEAEEDVD